MKKKNNTVPEIIIPKGYDIEEIVDMDEDDFGDEQPILTEEVTIRLAARDENNSKRKAAVCVGQTAVRR